MNPSTDLILDEESISGEEVTESEVSQSEVSQPVVTESLVTKPVVSESVAAQPVVTEQSSIIEEQALEQPKHTIIKLRKTRVNYYEATVDFIIEDILQNKYNVKMKQDQLIGYLQNWKPYCKSNFESYSNSSKNDPYSIENITFEIDNELQLIKFFTSSMYNASGDILSLLKFFLIMRNITTVAEERGISLQQDSLNNYTQILNIASSENLIDTSGYTKMETSSSSETATAVPSKRKASSQFHMVTRSAKKTKPTPSSTKSKKISRKGKEKA